MGQSEWSVESWPQPWQMSELVSVLGCQHSYLSASRLCRMETRSGSRNKTHLICLYAFKGNLKMIY